MPYRDREERLAHGRNYWRQNKERLAVYHREYRRKHRRRRTEIQRAWAKKNREKLRLASKRSYAKNRNHRRAMEFKRVYGITVDQKDAMFKAQGSCCACCGAAESGSKIGWHTDHVHGTKRVRGVICQICNLQIGRLGDTYEAVRESALMYMRYLSKAEWRRS